MEQPLVSIIVNNYNYGMFLGEAIDSALGQTYQNIEVVVVDDGSTDHSRELIASYGSSIIPVIKENGGQASAFNAGFAASRGAIVSFLDSDDVFLVNKVQTIVDCFLKYENTGWLFHGLDYIDRYGKHCGKCPVNQKTQTVDIRKKVSETGKIPFAAPATSGLCFKRTLLRRILPMPESIRITSDNYIKYASLIYSPGLYLDKILAYQRIHGQNAYTGSHDLRKRGNIHCQIAYYLALNIKESKVLAHKLMASALSELIRAGSIKTRPPEADQYLSSLGFVAKARIYARAVLKAVHMTLKSWFTGTSP